MKIKVHGTFSLISARLLFIMALAITGSNALAQNAPATAERLRTIFNRAYGAHLTLLSDEIAERSNYLGGGRFWLARVRPKKAGFYTIRFRYQNTKDSLPLGENEFYIHAGEKNCRRNYDEFPSFASICLDDSVIVPINVEKYARHEFVYVQPGAPPVFDDAYFASRFDVKRLDDGTVTDSAFPAFKYLGRFHHASEHRSAGGLSVDFMALLEAGKEGRYNLRISSEAPAGLDASRFSASSLIVPILVAARGRPVTVLAPHEKVHKFDERQIYQVHDSEHYYVTLRVVQPGDKIAFKYQAVSTRNRGREWESRGWFGDIKPVIKLEPFFLDKKYGYNEWLLKYL